MCEAHRRSGGSSACAEAWSATDVSHGTARRLHACGSLEVKRVSETLETVVNSAWMLRSGGSSDLSDLRAADSTERDSRGIGIGLESGCACKKGRRRRKINIGERHRRPRECG